MVNNVFNLLILYVILFYVYNNYYNTIKVSKLLTVSIIIYLIKSIKHVYAQIIDIITDCIGNSFK